MTKYYYKLITNNTFITSERVTFDTNADSLPLNGDFTGVPGVTNSERTAVDNFIFNEIHLVCSWEEHD